MEKIERDQAQGGWGGGLNCATKHTKYKLRQWRLPDIFINNSWIFFFVFNFINLSADKLTIKKTLLKTHWFILSLLKVEGRSILQLCTLAPRCWSHTLPHSFTHTYSLTVTAVTDTGWKCWETEWLTLTLTLRQGSTWRLSGKMIT